MPATNAEYFQARAEQELERAQQATDSRVVAVHFALASFILSVWRSRIRQATAANGAAAEPIVGHDA